MPRASQGSTDPPGENVHVVFPFRPGQGGVLRCPSQPRTVSKDSELSFLKGVRGWLSAFQPSCCCTPLAFRPEPKFLLN